MITEEKNRIRYHILLLVCMMTAVNYIGRTNVAVAAPYIEQELGLTPAMMGLVFSAFAWTYAAGQIPSGWILDRYGARVVYGLSMFLWSVLIGFMGWAGGLFTLILCRLGLGVCGAPTFPANNRVVTTWFPTQERGLAVGGYIGAQYIGLAFLTPALTWIIVSFGWPHIFFLTGLGGIVLAYVWYCRYTEPASYPGISAAELTHIRAGGGFCDSSPGQNRLNWRDMRILLRHRQIWGMCIGNFTIASTAYFFTTWFPSYLVHAKGLHLLEAGFYTSLPFLAAFAGVFIGGRWSDGMLARGRSLAAARKGPIMAGLLFSCGVPAANYTNDIWLAVLIMSIAFIGQNIANTCGWALLADVAPQELVGVTGGLYNFSANLSGIVTPMMIGLLVSATQSYELALWFVAFIAFIGLLSFAFVVGRPYRMTV